MSSSLPYLEQESGEEEDSESYNRPHQQVPQIPPAVPNGNDHDEAITIGGPFETFHAFVIYDKKPDSRAFAFVQLLLQKLEDNAGLKLCLMERDVMAGVNILYAISRLIDKRCCKVIFVLTKAFSEDWECDFALKYALTLQPQVGPVGSKVLPIKIESDANIPSVLSPTQIMDYTKEDIKRWFWPRLEKTLTSPTIVRTSTRMTQSSSHPPPGPVVCYTRAQPHSEPESGYRTDESQVDSAASAAGPSFHSEDGASASTRSIIDLQNPLINQTQGTVKKKKSLNPLKRWRKK